MSLTTYETAVPRPPHPLPLLTTTELITTTTPHNALTWRLIACLSGILRWFATITTLFRSLKNSPSAAAASLVALHPCESKNCHTLFHLRFQRARSGSHGCTSCSGAPYACIFAGGFTEESMLVFRELGMQTLRTADQRPQLQVHTHQPYQ